MQVRQLHIIAFDNPYPPNYGGAIDMFYKVKALAALAVKVHLHIYTDTRNDVSGIVPFCETVTLYQRHRKFLHYLSLLPFTVKSRNSKTLYDNISSIPAPVLFESLRVCYLLKSRIFKQKTAVRCHNIEHHYSWGLSRSETHVIRKLAHYIEGYKQKWFESVLQHTEVLFPISKFEYAYYKDNFHPTSVFIPVFQGYSEVVSKAGQGKYALYHGDLSISDNIRAALFLIDVFKDIDIPLVIASSVSAKRVIAAIQTLNHITFRYVDSKTALEALIQDAHMNTLYSFQRSGTKLKVFTALFNGRHCVINSNMVDDPEILKCCHVAESVNQYRAVVRDVFEQPFVLTKERVKALKNYSDIDNAKKIIRTLF